MTRLLAALTLSLLAVPAWAQVEPACYLDPALEVIDGDSVRHDGVNTRMIGYDTPEIRQHECPEELALGQQATERLRDLLETHTVMLCTPGSDCGHGRPCGWLAILDGNETLDVGSILIAEGLAIPFTGSLGDWCN